MSADSAASPALERAYTGAQAAYGADWMATVHSIAPGRIELLGNHLDYNGGPVLAAAIDRTVVVILRERPALQARIRLLAVDTGSVIEDLDVTALRGWRHNLPPASPFDYARGAVAAILDRPDLQLRAPGEIVFAGDVPIGFGLSSSAALCVALVSALVLQPLPAKQLVLLAQEAEHRAGTPCGTMDQSASVAGGVIRFDGATLHVEHLAPDLDDFVFIVADSGVDRSLGASAYPTRVNEARQILDIARSVLEVEEIPHLAAINRGHLDQLATLGEDILPSPLVRRLRHVVSEIERVEQGMEALRRSDWPAFGALMTASGRSSAMDYEVSHPRVEELVRELLEVDGLLGARMMGGGGGGSVLALLPRQRVALAESCLRTGYYDRYGMLDRRDLVQECRFAPGAQVKA